MYSFNRSAIGYSHIKNKKKCQDFSATYKDNERIIVTSCDGHGGNIYVRSDLGSRFASDAIIKVFKEISLYETRKLDNKAFLEAIKLGILCEWNRLVESDLAKNHLNKSELKNLAENERDKLLSNKVKAYGTTLIGAMTLGSKLLVIHLGDGEALLLKDNDIIEPFKESDDEPVGNITYSMCEEDAFKQMNIKAFNLKDFDGILLCSDGLVNPYQSYKNFKSSFVNPLFNELNKTGNTSTIELFVENMSHNLGIGDDVTLSFIYKNKKETKAYKRIVKEKENISYNDYYKLIY